jgi:hypothetical protein
LHRFLPKTRHMGSPVSWSLKHAKTMKISKTVERFRQGFNCPNNRGFIWNSFNVRVVI